MDSGDRVRMATQLQEQLSEQSATDPNLEGTDPSLEQLSEQSAARCVVSRGGAQDGANPEAHAPLVSSMAALFIEWFTSDRRLHRCTRPQPLAAALGTSHAATGSDKLSGSGGGRCGGGSLAMSGVLLPLLLGMLLLGIAFVSTFST